MRDKEGIIIDKGPMYQEDIISQNVHALKRVLKNRRGAYNTDGRSRQGHSHSGKHCTPLSVTNKTSS